MCVLCHGSSDYVTFLKTGKIVAVILGITGKLIA